MIPESSSRLDLVRTHLPIVIPRRANSNTNAIIFVVVRVVLQLLTPVAVRSHRRIVVVPRRRACRLAAVDPCRCPFSPSYRRRPSSSPSYSRTVVSCHRNCRLGPKPNNRRRRCLRRTVSPSSCVALLSRVTRHSRKYARLVVALCKLE